MYGDKEVFFTRTEYNKFKQQHGDLKRYIILSEQPQEEQQLFKQQQEQEQVKQEHLRQKQEDIRTQSTTNQQHTTRPTKEDKLKIIKQYLENEELIDDETHKQIYETREEEEEAEILTDGEEETTNKFIFKNEEDIKRYEKVIKEDENQPEEETRSNATESTESTEEDSTEDKTTPKHKTEETLNDDVNYKKKLQPSDILDNVKYDTMRLIEHLILENAYENNLCSNVGDINLIKYYTEKDKKIEPITTPFLDNITMFKLFAPDEMAGQYIKPHILSLWNIHVRDLCVKHKIKVVPHSVKFKKPVMLKSTKGIEAQTRATVLELIQRQPYIKTEFLQRHNLDEDIFKDCFIGVIKLELADEDFYKIEPKLKALEDELKQFNSQIYIKDVDCTIDYAGTFDRDEIEEHLIKNHEFNKQGETYDVNNKYIILNNTQSVGNGTLTFNRYGEDGRLKYRFKYYNKPFCQFTSPGVSTTTGNHLHDFLDCPDERLKTTFKNTLAKERGITRLEITMYGNYIPTTEKMERLLDKLYNFVNVPIFYYVPIRNLWRNITDHIQNNLIIINRKARILYIVYYVNLQTRKITGVKYRMSNIWSEHDINKCLNYVLCRFSYNVIPCYLIEIDNMYSEDYDEHFKEYLENKKIKQAKRGKTEEIEDKLTVEDIKLTLTAYEKLAGKTALCKSTSIYTHSADKIDIEEAGLINTDFIEFIIADKKQNVESKAEYTIKQTTTDKEISTKTLKDREEWLRTQERTREQIKYKQEQEEETQRIQTYYKQLKEQKAGIIALQQAYKDKVSHYIKVLKGIAKTTANLAPDELITITGFYIRQQKDSDATIIYREEDETAYYAPEYVKAIINNSSNKKQFINYGGGVYGLDNFNALLTIKQNGINPNGSKKWRAYGFINERLKEPATQAELTQQGQHIDQQINQITIRELKLRKGFKNTEAVKMETLNLNTEYTITEIAKKEFKTKNRYYFKVQGDEENIYIANDFLAGYLQNSDNKLLLKFKTLDLATTANRHKALNITPIETDKKKKCEDIALSR